MQKKATAVALLAALSSSAEARPKRVDPARGAPMLAAYTDALIDDELWDREALGRRDRSLVTVAALAAAGRGDALGPELARALDHGVEPLELAELVTHVAFYAGWSSGTAAATELARVVDALGLEVEVGTAPQLALDPEAEAARRASVNRIAPLAPSLAHDTNELLFGDVWRRPGLAPRDRSLVTVATLIALGQAEQLPFHLGRALDAGLTEAEASEVVSQLAFVCGWPRAFSALKPMGEVFRARHEAAVERLRHRLRRRMIP